MKKIYILLMHTNTLPSKFVKLFTNYKYSHVAISLTEDCYMTYSFGRKELHNIFNGGLSVQKKDGEFFSLFNKTECKIYEVNVTDEQYNNVKEKLEYMSENSADYKYDFLGIVPRWLGIPINFKDRFVCSYFVANILETTNICNFNKNACMVLPKDFRNLEELKEIYDGRYLTYKTELI